MEKEVGESRTYSSMSIIALAVFEEMPVLVFAVDHAAVHGDCVGEDGVEETGI